MKRFKMLSVFLCIVMGIAGFAGTAGAVNVSLTGPASVGKDGVFELSVKVDDAATLCGAALTLVYESDKVDVVDSTGVIKTGELNRATDITSDVFKMVYDNRTTTATQDIPMIGNNINTTAKLLLSGAYVSDKDVDTTIKAGAGAYTGEQKLFTVRFKAKAAPPATLNFSLQKTQLCNPAAGWGVDADNNGVCETLGEVDPLIGVPNGWATLPVEDQFTKITTIFTHTAEAPYVVNVVAGVTVSQSYKLGLNLVPFTVAPDGVTKASHLDAKIVAAGGTVSQIFGWDAQTQKFTSAYVNLGGGITMGDFDLKTGISYFIDSTAASVQLTGTEFTSLPLFKGLNVVAVPASKKATITKASQLDAEIKTKTGLDVSQIFGWNSTTQKFTSAYVNLGGGITMGDFDLLVEGEGYFVEVSGNGTYTP